MPEVLPPIEQLPKDVRPGVPLDQLAHNADWAETFAPSDRSFAQRFRHNRDIREYGEALQARKAAAIEAQARTNATAQSFYFRDKELDLKRREQEQDMQFRDRLFPLEQEAKEEQIAASRALAAARVQAAKIAAKTDRIKGEHIAGFSEHMNAILDEAPDPDSPDYQQGILRGIALYPHGKELAEQYWKATRSPVSIDEAVANFKAAQTQAPGAIVGTTTRGGTTLRTPAPPKPVAGPTLEDDRAYYSRRINELRTRLPSADAEMKPGLTTELNEMAARLAETEAKIGGATGSTAPATAAAPAAIKPKQVRQNGVIYTLQPDGSYK